MNMQCQLFIQLHIYLSIKSQYRIRIGHEACLSDKHQLEKGKANTF